MVTLDEENFKGLLGLAARPCDTCCTAAALLYCKVDAAFLCGACDSKLHRHVCHERVWMCEVCEQAPAAVTCKADAAVLCTACDHDIHSANPLARRHERVPVVPFLDSADDAAVVRSSSTAAPAAATSLLISDDLAAVPAPIAPALLRGGDGDDDEVDAETWLIPNPSFLYSNDSDLLHHHFGPPSLSSSLNNLNHNSQQEQQHKMNIQQQQHKMNIQQQQHKINIQQQQHKMNIQQQQQSASFAFTDSVVPSQSNGNLSFSNDVTHSFQNCFDIDFSQPHKHHNKIISTFNNYSSPLSVSSSDIGVVPDGNANSMSEVSYTFAKSTTTGDGGSSTNTGSPAPVIDREARVLRYREKRKNRKFEKTIRYASRKAYAETRPRIKGRFAKRTETSDVVSEIDQIYGAGFGLDHGGYGVVPSF